MESTSLSDLTLAVRAVRTHMSIYIRSSSRTLDYEHDDGLGIALGDGTGKQVSATSCVYCCSALRRYPVPTLPYEHSKVPSTIMIRKRLNDIKAYNSSHPIF
jgi:hypothetical protein